MKELRDLAGEGPENSDTEKPAPIESVKESKLRGRLRKRAKTSREKRNPLGASKG